MTYTGKMRVHFNRLGAAPLVWCVATDHWELAVAGVAIRGDTTSRYVPKATADEDDGKPSAWFDVEGTLEVVENVAYIVAVPAEPPAETPA